MIVPLALIIATIATQPASTTSSGNCAPPPGARYDYDLFHKDTETSSSDIEFLYWTVNEGAVDYAQKMHQPAGAIAPSYASGKVHSAIYRFDSGVRITIGYFNAPKYWEVYGRYTHLIARGKNRVEPPATANEFLTGTWPQIIPNPLTHAHSNIYFNYNLFDLLIDRVFITNPHLRLRLTGGGSTAWIKQDWKSEYFDGSNNTTIRNRWQFIGGGICLGLMTDWYWGNHIYLTGSSAVTLYMGSYHNRSKQVTSLQSLPVRNSNFSDTRPALSLHFTIGPSWQQNFGCHRVEVFTGYELTGWFNLQEIHRSSSGTASAAKETWLNNSMIALQGLTTRLTVDF